MAVSTSELLAMQGMNSEMFEQQLRQEFAMQQVLTGVARSALAPASVAAASLDPLLQRREVQVLRFDPATYRSKVNPSEAEVEAYYKSQAAMFKSPEQASIEYVVLDLEALGKEPQADRGGTAQVLRRQHGALHRTRRAACQPHPDQGRQGRASSAERAKAKASRRGAVGRGAQEPRQLCRPGAQELAGRYCCARRRPGLLWPWVPWSSPLKMRPSR
jgi:hypothetical protein